MSEILRIQNQKISELSERAVEERDRFLNELKKLEHEFEKYQLKDKANSLKEGAEKLTSINEEAIQLVANTSKKLFGVVEQIAEKELERDPINFIRRES